ncbi:MAG TPA: flagellar hook-basal body complex protein, partial [Stenotrophomonas sp.]|nr:flagellar hook-basal body complex protein [Stenotrophomonas sp.]
MFQALYNSLSGLFSFSRSLDTVSNNVANMNTPGFRGSDSLFSNLSGEHGARIVGEAMRTAHGDLRQTESPTDVAIDGNGYFVLRDEAGELHYTRAGQFGFDDDGILVDQVTGFDVMAIDSGGNLSQLSIEDLRTLPAQATTKVTISGNLSPTSTGTTVSSIKVYDANGNAHTIKAAFGAPTMIAGGGRSYAVTLTDENGATVGKGQLDYTTAGTLASGSGALTATLDVAGES